MQVFLNEWCLQAQDLHKLEEYIDTLLQKGVKHIYYAKNIEDVITKTLIDDNELSIWLSTFEKIQNQVSVFQTVYEEGINYFMPILNPNQRQMLEVGHTAIEFEKPFVFEVFDFNGTHIGELSFDGVLRPQNKHEIKVTC